MSAPSKCGGRVYIIEWHGLFKIGLTTRATVAARIQEIKGQCPPTWHDRCTALTRHGRQCQIARIDGHDLCRMHMRKASGEKQEPLAEVVPLDAFRRHRPVTARTPVQPRLGGPAVTKTRWSWRRWPWSRRFIDVDEMARKLGEDFAAVFAERFK